MGDWATVPEDRGILLRRTWRAQIRDGILGVSTWQAVCAANAIPWPPPMQSA